MASYLIEQMAQSTASTLSARHGGHRKNLKSRRANTDIEARDAARPAYELWHENLTLLWRAHGVPIPLKLSPSFDEAVAAGLRLVGSPSTVRAAALAQVESAGVNYLLCRMAFGDLPMEISEQSVELFSKEVMPAFPAQEICHEFDH